MIATVHDTRALALVLALALASGALSAVAPSITAAQARSGNTVAGGRSLLQSRELWATVDVCNPKDQPNTIGIRGSMPGDGHGKDAMYMRFQLQYLEAKGNVWVNLHDGDSGFITIGAAKIGRQGGWSGQVTPVAGKPAFTIRGLVTFQWRHGARILYEATRTTSAAHKNVADADPAGYSAAECAIG
jgi:hypothetical protein